MLKALKSPEVLAAAVVTGLVVVVILTIRDHMPEKFNFFNKSAEATK